MGKYFTSYFFRICDFIFFYFDILLLFTEIISKLINSMTQNNCAMMRDDNLSHSAVSKSFKAVR